MEQDVLAALACAAGAELSAEVFPALVNAVRFDRTALRRGV
ncbi:hypothetical protein ACFWP7_34160 [Streptomyces sp. NPDC058470]